MSNGCSGGFFKDHYKIHATWLIFLLGLIVVGLVSVISRTDLKLGDFIQTSSILTSLILAILAIIYSFYSNDTLLKQISSLTDASKKISESAESIYASSHGIEDHITRTTTNIIDEVKKLKQESEKSIPTRESSSPAQALTDKTVEEFLDYSSPSGLITLYVATRASQLEKPIKFKQLMEAMKDDSHDYYWGYLVATNAMNIIDLKSLKVNKKTVGCAVKYVHPYLAKHIEASIDASLNNSSESTKARLIEKYSRVRALFAD